MKKSLVVLIALMIFAGCGSSKDSSAWLAKIGGESVTQNEFQKRLETLPKELRRAAFDRKKEFVDDIVAERLLYSEALRSKVDRDPDVADLIQSARRKIIISKLIETEVDRKLFLGKDEALKYYETHKDEFMAPLVLHASHMLVKTRDEAQALIQELNAGADFGELAKSHSLDTTAPRGGDLGFFQKGRFVPEFEDVVFSMKKGETSGVVQTRFGYHIVRLNDRIEPTLREFGAVRQQVEQRLLSERRTELYKALVDRLKSRANIRYNEVAIEKMTEPVDAKKSISEPIEATSTQ